MPLGIIQGYRACALIGSSVMPALPGVTLSMPKNYNIPVLLTGANSFQLNAVEGLQFPTLGMVLAVTQSWFNAATLASWLARVSDDVGDCGNMTVWDGATGIEASGTKLSDFSIGVSQGELVRCNARFLAVLGQVLGGAPTSTLITDTPAAFQHTGYDNVGASSWNPEGVVSWDLRYSNNLSPNPALPTDETAEAENVSPQEINAGMFTATLRLVMLANKPAPGTGDAIKLAIKAPGGASVSFTATNLLLNDPQERQFAMPRNLRTYNYTLLGQVSGGNLLSPILIS